MYLSVILLADNPRTFAATSPTISTPCMIQRKRSTATATTVILPSDRVTSLLCNLRGGNDNTINGGSRDDKNKLNSVSIRHQQQASLVLQLQRFQTLGIKGWKYAVERVAPKTIKGIVASDDPIEMKNQGETQPSISAASTRPSHYSTFQMYCSCMGIVSLWILTGTFFYSYTNEWPIPQSFFYAVDAGMSIGFCTDVRETKLGSKAFTIVYILLGASVVGGALWLFIQDIVEGVVERERNISNIVLTKEYELMLGKEDFEHVDVSHTTGTLTKDEFTKLLKSTGARTSSGRSSTTPPLSEDDIDVLWTKFDRIKDGAIRFEEFAGTYHCIEGLINSLHSPQEEIQSTAKIVPKWISSLASSVSSFTIPLLQSENRIYVVFLAWVFLGIAWGMLDQGWDPITATHFAISALATGGLTAPPVNSNGILPARPSIFCGFYCLFGIPLMAITFGHFARVLVSDHVAAMEKWALTRPITAKDYEIAKQYLVKTTGTSNADSRRAESITKRRQMRQQETNPSLSSSTAWRGLRLSDFIVLQILRQGRISVETINILRKEFALLDTDKTGILTLEEATNWSTTSVAKQGDEEIVLLP